MQGKALRAAVGGIIPTDTPNTRRPI